MEKKIEYALMRKDAEELAVEPEKVAAKQLEGWNVVGLAVVDAKGKITEELGRVIETPAHTIETADGFLRVIPKFEAPPLPVPPLVVPPPAVEPKK